MSDAITRLNTALEGRYRVERELGEGGMATVYLADDLRHERKVALKVLKPELAAVVGGERFLAEIKTTANLQHPHILPLFDSGEAEGFLFFVMPHIEGETLRERINRDKQLPVDEAVRIATAVANALHTAHEQGIVHRDIKPANILLSRGEPLIADFGIALAVGAAGGSRLTETGLSVGTPYYMSPEQATGDQHVGPPTDTYALGAVLYEMLTGDPPFMGNTAQAVLGQIIAGEPVSATKKRRSIPSNVDAAIRKALEKLPADRFTGADDFARALADAGFRYGGATTTAAGAGAGPWKPLALVMTALSLVLLGTTILDRIRSEPDRVVRLNIELPGDEGLAFGAENRLALSPDGTLLVYVGLGQGATTQLWLRDFSRLNASPLRGTDGTCCPTFSPDGQSVAYVERASQLLKTMSVGGGSATTIASGVLPDRPSWGADGYIYVAADPGGGVFRGALYRVPATGGDLDQVTVVDLAANEALHNTPSVLPSGNGMLFSIGVNTGLGRVVAVVDFATREHRVLANGLVPLHAGTGHLMYISEDGVLLAAPFDEQLLETTGPSVALAEGLVTRISRADIAISESGTLIYGAGSVGTESLVWVDREGDWEAVESGWIEDFETVALSSGGDRLAVSIDAGANDHQLWTRPLPVGSLTRLTNEGGLNFRPFFSADGEDVLFVSDRGDTPNDLYSRPVDGGVAELVLDLSDRNVWEGEWSPDGEWLIYRTGIPPTRDLFVKNVHPDSAGRTISASDNFEEVMPTLSPDGRWLAYQSDETGRDEIWVRPFPNIDDDQRQVSSAGGTEPLWSRDGTELFYKNGSGELVAARVSTDSGFSVLERNVLFSVAEYQGSREFCCHPTYDVHPDGERFIMIRRVGGEGELVLVQNFFTELRERVGS